MTRRETARLIALSCSAFVLVMLSISTFASLLPFFKDEWQLSNTEAGWISAIYFAGYLAAVPVLVTITDRVDGIRIFMGSAALMAVANFGFAYMAEGFWTAMAFRCLAGMALAGTYMPGLKALTDRLDQGDHSRATAFYVASFSIGVAISYPLAGVLTDRIDWHTAFAVTGIAALLALALVTAAMPGRDGHDEARPVSALLDFRPILRNRQTMAYSLCYSFHNWELFGYRGWIVAFLVFTESLHGKAPDILGPAVVAAVITVLSAPTNVLGNEISMRLGRRLSVTVIMGLSALVCFAVGFTSALSYFVAALFCLIHGLTIIGESSSVTAGALGHAPPGYRGATMAFHTMIGFVGSFLGPLVFGLVLDAAGGTGVFAWGLAFAHMGLVMLAGPVVLALLRPAPLPGDRR